MDPRYAAYAADEAYNYLKGSRWDLLKELFPSVPDADILDAYVRQPAVSGGKRLYDTVQELLQR